MWGIVLTRDSGWLHGATLYQIYPLSFLDANGDGIGDLDGVLARLDHVAALGVDAIWLSPFYPSPLKDFGYDVSDHRDVDPRLGTLATFDRLLAAAHGRGLRVLVDLICGHTADTHPWFRDSRRSGAGGHRRAGDGEHADWYVWADPSPDGTPPNNWLSVFGGSAWSWEPRRRQYYLHHFLAAQPTLNLANDAVLSAVLDTARFWLDRGVDGFRIDAVDFLARDPALRSNPPADRAAGALLPVKPFGMQRHHHDMMHADIPRILARLRAVADGYPGRVLLGELSSQDGAALRLERYTRPGGLHAAYTLELARKAFTPRSFQAALAACARSHGNCWNFSNHDVERAASRWRPPGADPERFNALLARLFGCLPGTLCLYQGEELGLPQAVLDPADLRDPFGITYWPEFAGRDGSRTPMPWTAGTDHAGFTTAARPWLPVPEAHHALAVDRQEERPDSPLAIWRHCLALRRRLPALSRGVVGRIVADDAVLAFERQSDEETILAVFNFTNAPATFRMPNDGRFRAIDLSGAMAGVTVESDGGLIRLPPLGSLLAARERAVVAL